MTVVALLCDPPRAGVVLPGLVSTSPLSPEEAAELYAALTRDVVRTVLESGGDLLVNYRSIDDDPDESTGGDGDEAEAEVRSVVADVVDPDEVRFEVQVGETFAGRAGNTATHLLEAEDASSVGIATPEAALLARTDVDSAAMTLRRSPVVIGPSPGGRVYYAAFAEPIDFTDAYAPPAVATLTDRAVDAGLDVAYLAAKPLLEDAEDLAEVITWVRTRRTAGQPVPTHLAAWVAETDLVVDPTAEGLRLTR